jgi:hypothetical protein
VQETRPTATFYRQAWRGFRSRHHKYTVLEREGELRPWQFFDVENDPYEMKNLLEETSCQELVAQHHQWLRERMIETGDHAWLGGAFGYEPLNAWVPCSIGG